MYRIVFILLATLAILATIIVLSTNAQSQSRKPGESADTSVIVDKKVLCDFNERIIGSVTGGDFKEAPVFVGNDKLSESKTTLFINRKTGSWTMVQANERVGCIVTAGEAHILLNDAAKSK
jgi:hypothetical protein